MPRLKQRHRVNSHEVQPVPLSVPVGFPQPTRLFHPNPFVELRVHQKDKLQVQVRPRLHQSRPGPPQDAQLLAGLHRLPHLDGDGGQVGVDRKHGQTSPVMPDDHLLSVVRNLLVVVYPHDHAVRTGPDGIQRLAPGIAPERPDIDPLVEPLEDPRRLGRRGAGEAEHAGDQPPADRWLVEFLGLVFEQIPVFRRQLPADAIPDWLFLSQRCGSQKNAQPR